MEIRISSERYTATADTHGAELVSLVYGGNELIWSGDAWKRHAPVLFPFVCNTASKKYTVNGKGYALNNHGFARDSEFEVAEHTSSSVTFILRSSEETLSHYPYPFELLVRYTLGDSLRTEFIVRNTGSTDMRFFIGGHPAFRVPFTAEPDSSYTDYDVVYEKPETIVQHLPGGDHTVLDGTDRVAVTRELFKNDVFLKDKPLSSDVSIVSRRTGSKVTVSYDSRGTIAVWSAYDDNADFICLEPWAQTPVYDGGSEELTEMTNALTLAAGGEYVFCYGIRYE